MAVRALGDGIEEMMVVLAGRRRGLTIPEAAARFDATYCQARRAFLRLARAGRLWPTTLRRRRAWFFERATKPSVVWKARWKQPDYDERHRRWNDEGELALWRTLERRWERGRRA